MDWRNPHPADFGEPEPEPQPGSGDWRNHHPADFDKTELDGDRTGLQHLHFKPTTPKGWIPGEAVRSHAGYHLKKHLDFLAPPPPEIGEVISAWSTMKIGDAPPPQTGYLSPGKVFLGASVFFLGLLGMIGLSGIAMPVVSFAIASVLAVASFLGVPPTFRREVSYVGESGVARYVCCGSRFRIEKSEVFEFADAEELRSAVTHVYVDLLYGWTECSNVWKNTQGRTISKIEARHRSKSDAPPESDDPFYLARSAELAWSLHRLPEILGRIATDGAYDFPLERGSFVRIAEGRIEFHSEKRVVEVERDELARAELSKGLMQFGRARTTRGTCEDNGRFCFKYKEIANARLFLLLLDKLMNVRFAD